MSRKSLSNIMCLMWIPNSHNFNTRRGKKVKKISIIFILVVVSLALAACGQSGYDFENKFSDIAENEWITIAEDGSFIRIDTNPRNVRGGDFSTQFLAMEDLERVNEELGFSDALIARMTSTRALDGRQEEVGDTIRVSWSFHPNSGLVVMYEIRQ